MEYIGKSTKFYTLWNVWEDKRMTSHGTNYTITHYQYVKNISFDKNKAISTYPNAIVDETLRGHHSWSSYKYEQKPVDEFCGGKYSGTKIAECTDYSYLQWAWDNTNIIPYDSREMVVAMLENNGYRKINDSKIATPEEVEMIDASYEDVENAAAEIEKTGKITVNAYKNLDSFGHLLIKNVDYTFPKYKEMYYQGNYYALPIDSKGKAKRIKNKTVEIIPSSYEIRINNHGWGATLSITVKDFKVK